MYMIYIKVNDVRKSAIIELDQGNVFQGISLPQLVFIVMVQLPGTVSPILPILKSIIPSSRFARYQTY